MGDNTILFLSIVMLLIVFVSIYGILNTKAIDIDYYINCASKDDFCYGGTTSGFGLIGVPYHTLSKLIGADINIFNFALLNSLLTVFVLIQLYSYINKTVDTNDQTMFVLLVIFLFNFLFISQLTVFWKSLMALPILLLLILNESVIPRGKEWLYRVLLSALVFIINPTTFWFLVTVLLVKTLANSYIQEYTTFGSQRNIQIFIGLTTLLIGAVASFYEGMYLVAYVLYIIITLPLLFAQELDKLQIVIIISLLLLVLATPLVLYRDVGYRFVILSGFFLLLTYVRDLVWLLQYESLPQLICKITYVLNNSRALYKAIAIMCMIFVLLFSITLTFM